MKALSHMISVTMKHVRVRGGSGKIKCVEIRQCRDKYTYNIHVHYPDVGMKLQLTSSLLPSLNTAPCFKDNIFQHMLFYYLAQFLTPSIFSVILLMSFAHRACKYLLP